MSRKLTDALFVVASIGISVAILPYRLRFPFDDVFISFRYAEHLADGYGLVWNVGGPHVEGYTNFLYVCILAAFRSLGFDLLLASQILACVCTVVSVVLVKRFAESISQPIAGWLAALLFITFPLVWINALSGMETSLFMLVVLLTLLLGVRKHFTLGFFVAFLAMLVRPEGGVLSLPLVGAMWIECRDVQRVARSALYFALPLLAYLLWKYWYFGWVLPNSFYVKVGAGGALPGLQYVRLFVTSVIPLLLAVLLMRRRDLRSGTLMAAGFAAVLLTFYLLVRPLEGLYDRFLMPVVAPLAALAAAALTSRFKGRAVALPAVLLLAIEFVVATTSPRTEQSLAAHEGVWDASMDNIVHVIQRIPHYGDLRLLYGDAGYVVERLGIQHIDPVGLNTTSIAHATSTDAKRRAILAERPDLLLLPYDRAADTLVEDAYGVADLPQFDSVTTLQAFPYPLRLLVDRRSRSYSNVMAAFR